MAVVAPLDLEEHVAPGVRPRMSREASSVALVPELQNRNRGSEKRSARFAG